MTPEEQRELAESLAAEKNLQYACARLQEVFGRAILGRVNSRVSDPAAAHDVVSDTWELVMKKIHSYDPNRAPFYSFVRMYADQQVLRYFQKMQRNKEEVCENMADFRSDLTPEKVLIQKQTAQARLRKYNLLLETTLRVGGQAHHILAFGFSEVIFPMEKQDGDMDMDGSSANTSNFAETTKAYKGSGEKRSSGYPRRVVNELSDQILRRLGCAFEEKYRHYSVLPKRAIAGCFQCLHRKMGRPFRQTQSTVGETSLRTYYGSDPEHNISDWSYKVKQKVKQCILKKQYIEWIAENGSLGTVYSVSDTKRNAVKKNERTGTSVY